MAAKKVADQEEPTVAFSGPGDTHADPGEDVARSREESVKATGADAAVGAVRPAESQIRGSFMPGGGAGEDAHTAYDPETHAGYPATATEEEKQAAIDAFKQGSQQRHDQDVEAGLFVAARPGVDTTNPAPTEAALAATNAIPADDGE